MTSTELDFHYKAHLEKQERIWNALYWKLYHSYIAKDYLPYWAQVKAEQEVLELRSTPNNGID